MKKLISLSLMIASFMVISNSATAQKFINNTACDMEMAVVWGTSTCVVNGSFDAIVPANSTVAYPMPNTDVVIQAKGRYLSASCSFYVGISCTPYPTAVFVPCSFSACGDYKAHITGPNVEAYQ